MPKKERARTEVQADGDLPGCVREGFDQLIQEMQHGPSERVETFRSLVAQYHEVSISYANHAVETEALYEQPLPDFFTSLPDDQQILYGQLAAAMQADRIEIVEQDGKREQGTSRPRRVTVRQGMDSRNQVLTLLHEYGHQLLHKRGEARAIPLWVKEGQAEAVAYIAAHCFHLHSPDSADYLWYWQTTPEDLLTGREIIEHIASLIVNRVGPSSG